VIILSKKVRKCSLRPQVTKGAPYLKRSKVVSKGGGSAVAESRTSSGAFLTESDPILEKYDEKIAAWTQLPVTHSEHFYLLR
jgi:prolyl 4-hydroxylase